MGFDLAEIVVPTGVWHGLLGRTVPVGSAEYIADVVPNAQLTVHDDVGHLSLPVNYARKILTDLTTEIPG